MGLSIYDEHTAYLVTKPIDNTNGVVPVTMVEPTIGALRVDAIIAASFAAADHIIEVVMNGPSDVAFLANVNIPAGAGTGVIPVVDLIPLVAPTAIGALVFPPGTKLDLRAAVTLDADEYITFCILGGYV